MKLFFERTETEDKTLITFKPYSMYVLLTVLILLTALTFIPALAPYGHLTVVLMPLAAIVVVGRIIFMYKVNREIQQAIRDDKVVISGGKLSTKNPLTFEITKSTATL